MAKASSNGCPEGGSESGVEFGGERVQGCWWSTSGLRPKTQKRDDLARRTRSARILRPPYGNLAPEVSVANIC